MENKTEKLLRVTFETLKMKTMRVKFRSHLKKIAAVLFFQNFLKKSLYGLRKYATVKK
jgi:hypothetical protein